MSCRGTSDPHRKGPKRLEGRQVLSDKGNCLRKGEEGIDQLTYRKPRSGDLTPELRD